jgi:hypothetical protein
MSDASHDITLAVWQPYARHELTAEDARQINENVASFFRLLAGWAAQAGASTPGTGAGERRAA